MDSPQKGSVYMKNFEYVNQHILKQSNYVIKFVIHPKSL